jgi:hypothetical protein
VKGPQVAAYFSTNVDGGKWADGVYQNVVVGVDAKGSAEVGGVVVKVVDAGDELKEVGVYVLLLGAPEFLAAFVNNSVLVRVLVSGEVASRGGEEVGEEFDFDKEREREDGKDGSGWAWGRDTGNRGFGDRRREIFDGDVSKGDAVNHVLKLAMCVLVLVLVGGGVLELRAFYVSLLCGDISKDIEEVGQGDGGVGEDGDRDEGQGAILVETRVVTIQAWIVPGVVRTVEEVLDDLGGSSNVLLIDVIDL